MMPPRILLAMAAGIICACTNYAHNVDQFATAHSLAKELYSGTPFDHVVFRNNATSSKNSQTLHVYIDGDGQTWINNKPAIDPTSRNPISLRLMAIDSSPAIYVGRPCHLGTNVSKDCESKVWTDARYSAAVVDSMKSVILSYRDNHDFDQLVLIGYSGGGVIATLLAARMNHVTAVVTLAANLDVDRWAGHHSYDPLVGSLDPANEPALDQQIVQIHLTGFRDNVVPPAVQERYFAVNPHAINWTYETFDHLCCWEEQWQRILQDIRNCIDAVVRNTP